MSTEQIATSASPRAPDPRTGRRYDGGPFPRTDHPSRTSRTGLRARRRTSRHPPVTMADEYKLLIKGLTCGVTIALAVTLALIGALTLIIS